MAAPVLDPHLTRGDNLEADVPTWGKMAIGLLTRGWWQTVPHRLPKGLTMLGR